ncbi:flagellar biosynthetic protein FliR [Spongisporangium articulatum]|uniref:Flagellar biosynthetic protein FliR n=1 Tax=Spongisporangium articulatum TaxID=3362603 RepID=A0ABW8AJT2_9ACTN
MDLSFGADVVAAFLLATARTAGFVLVAPPFSTRTVPQQVRAGVALTLAIPLSGLLVDSAPALGSSALISGLLLQLVLGAVLGFVVLLAVATVQTIGDLIDITGGFSAAVGMDPLGLNQSSVMGRIHNLLAVTLLFIGGGHLIVLQGLARGVETMPNPSFDREGLAHTMADGVASMILSAVQITAPIMAALLIADLALGLLTRAAPALNAFSLSFPLKIMLTLLMIGLVLHQIPGLLDRLVNHAGITMVQIAGG